MYNVKYIFLISVLILLLKMRYEEYPNSVYNIGQTTANTHGGGLNFEFTFGIGF
jgi:hypothetical protein